MVTMLFQVLDGLLEKVLLLGVMEVIMLQQEEEEQVMGFIQLVHLIAL